MGCSTCGKTKDLKLSKLGLKNLKKNVENLNSNSNEREYIFKGRLGKIVYFSMLLLIAFTPIINFIMAYVFYIAVYGGNKKIKKDGEQFNKDTNDTK